MTEQLKVTNVASDAEPTAQLPVSVRLSRRCIHTGAPWSSSPEQSAAFIYLIASRLNQRTSRQHVAVITEADDSFCQPSATEHMLA